MNWQIQIGPTPAQLRRMWGWWNREVGDPISMSIVAMVGVWVIGLVLVVLGITLTLAVGT